MPRATVNIQESIRKDLQTCPEGYVVLRRLSYGQLLQRREMSAKMTFAGNSKSDMLGELNAANQKVTEYEYANCIVEHNLEDENGTLLNFKQAWAVQSLDPRIGDEISKYIDELNQFEADLGNSSNGSVLASS